MMVIGVIHVNLSVQVTVQRLIVTYELVFALHARLIIGATIVIIPAQLNTAQVLVNVRRMMVPCVTNVILGDGVIFVNMIVPQTVLRAARSLRGNVM